MKKSNKFFARKFDLYLDIYGYTLQIFVTNDLPKSVAIEKIDGGDLTGTRAIHFAPRNESRSMIFLPLDASINEIAHESCHAVQNIIKWIEASYNDHEFVAYLFAHIVQSVYKFHEQCIVEWVKSKKKA